MGEKGGERWESNLPNLSCQIIGNFFRTQFTVCVSYKFGLNKALNFDNFIKVGLIVIQLVLVFAAREETTGGSLELEGGKQIDDA